ncbi:MAG: hypothetical protein MJZ16_07475 [Bacteroidales bacterium]|nr:hypothetical protein [Bacteroidales bacterium]
MAKQTFSYDNLFRGLKFSTISTPEKNLEELYDKTDITKPIGVYQKLEPRSRDTEYKESMAFTVHDPLWMLSRQWQFGRFKGNNCGSSVMTKITVDKRRLELVQSRSGKYSPLSNETPLEYEVEKRPHTIDPYSRLESALYFMDLVKARYLDQGQILAELKKKFPLDPFVPEVPSGEKTIEDLKLNANTKLKKMYAYFASRSFDGYKLFCSPKVTYSSNQAKMNEALSVYVDWFKKKYNISDTEEKYWNEEKLGYEVGLATSRQAYYAEDYHSGKLSWYSFDSADKFTSAKDKVETKVLSYIPSPAVFPSAPNRRLWEFENRRVQFNDYRTDDVKELASSVILQYTMLYSNDWMIVPIETEIGTVLDVKDIEIKDTFGNVFHINRNFEQVDAKDKSSSFTDRWALYSTVKASAYDNRDFSSERGLLCPPTVQRSEQGEAIEEVQFLRDEMSNMVWGVENRVSDGCGGSLDSRSRSEKVYFDLDQKRKLASQVVGGAVLAGASDGLTKGTDGRALAASILRESLGYKDIDVEKNKMADYSYLIQNNVPLHWIPFIPQKIQGKARDVVFRRGRMPIWFNEQYQAVRPSSELLGVKYQDGKVLPRYVNEEEILGYGTKVGLYPQRTRWFDGSSFTWRGFEKRISGYQANSGLMFDKLLEYKNEEGEK